jgi:hypothetical protein
MMLGGVGDARALEATPGGTRLAETVGEGNEKLVGARSQSTGDVILRAVRTDTRNVPVAVNPETESYNNSIM